MIPRVETTNLLEQDSWCLTPKGTPLYACWLCGCWISLHKVEVDENGVVLADVRCPRCTQSHKALVLGDWS